MRATTQALLWASCLIVGIGVGDAANAKNKGGVSASIGGKSLASAHANLGGVKGLRGHVSLGGKKGVANVRAKLGNTLGVKTSVATRKSLANVSVSVGKPVSLNVGVTIGGDDPKPNTSHVTNPGNSGVTGRDPAGAADGGSLTNSQRQAFQSMSSAERKTILKRCLSVGAGGYDPALAALCRLLRMSASR
jgi:hypothetical protein